MRTRLASVVAIAVCSLQADLLPPRDGDAIPAGDWAGDGTRHYFDSPILTPGDRPVTRLNRDLDGDDLFGDGSREAALYFLEHPSLEDKRELPDDQLFIRDTPADGMDGPVAPTLTLVPEVWSWLLLVTVICCQILVLRRRRRGA